MFPQKYRIIQSHERGHLTYKTTTTDMLEELRQALPDIEELKKLL